MSGRTGWIAAIGAGVAAVVLIAGCASPSGPEVPSAFYTPTAPLPAVAGRLIASQPLSGQLILPHAGQGRRILYTSTDGVTGRAPVAVSGTLMLPRGNPPAAGWPLISWAHATVGIADGCAPSWAGQSDRARNYLDHWLGAGYAVVGTDYQGLGTPGPHPYLDTRAEAYSVLDAIRAVRSGREPISPQVVIIGQSQGAGAAFAAAGEASHYAPELDIRGTVITGTPYFTTTAAPVTITAKTTGAHLVYAFFMLHTVKSADPNFKIEDHVTAAALPVVRLATTQCASGLEEAIKDQDLTAATAFTASPEAILAPYYKLFSYDTLTVKGPVFMGIGGRDTTVPPTSQQRLDHDACTAGSTIELRFYPHLGHVGTVEGALPDVTRFVRKAFAGDPITGNCPPRT